MKQIAILLLIALGGWAGYNAFFGAPSEAVQTYQHFADAIAREEFAQAEEYADGAALRYVEMRKLKYKAPVMQVFGKTAKTYSIKEIAGEVMWTKYAINRQQISEGGKKVSIEATQSVCRIAPNARAAFCRNPVQKRQKATLEQDDQGWWITSFVQDLDHPED